ncbi:pyrroloquinoline-quinone synthase PqqC [Solihabitans fulvus]|uniref:Pyrroloquinoline-quinone synthase n=1 Tax=Solihabitans fulvus TaxID=1892852 RepID=A0A5B2XHC4_9PSEU|nr:pyrroloquinoline-quinone synthase PqqC [Solihabitans fulvus]KAA2263248.1 pyrroloquinoline-quinone synthase PqqC [Solihabitans fulvus]
MSGAREPWEAEEFIAALRALAPRYWHDHPFHLRLHEGSLSKHELRCWAANRWYYQRCLPQKDAAILANCPLPDIRRHWLDRIVYHDGSAPGEGGAENWLRMAEALGLTREEVRDERHVLPGVRFAVDAYLTFARTRPWVESVASGLTEMFSPGLMRRRLADMRTHYPWIAEDGFAYFTSRLTVIAEEGKSTVDIVVRHSNTREQQEAAVAALAFKCDVLQAILDAVDYHGRVAG